MPFLYFVRVEWLSRVAMLEVPARSEQICPTGKAVLNAYVGHTEVHLLQSAPEGIHGEPVNECQAVEG